MRRAVIDLGAIRHNVGVLRGQVGPGVDAMVVVKANGYGHGAVPVARAALEAGASWLGVVDLPEALELRAAGVGAPILTWMHDPAGDLSAAVEHGIDLGVSSTDQLRTVPRGAVVQLKLDTGLGRNGAPPTEWPAFLDAAAAAERAGRVRIRGVWSHLAGVDDEVQVAAFTAGLDAARAAGLDPELTHLAASAAAQTLPSARFSLVRLGIATYGLGGSALPLRPAMTLEGTVISAKRVAAGTGVSYGHDHVTARETTLALVPLGYGDGIPRHASGRGPVRIGDRTFTVAGRVAMDQVVLDVGDVPVRVGDRAVLFGDPATGAPGAGDWAEAAGTIDYEIVTRIGPRVPREYLDAH
ncbi:MAG TPA: alanine racemase [Rhodoglobus sp.]|nr:alanine racemase [Rhodoglobus sp.]